MASLRMTTSLSSRVIIGLIAWLLLNYSFGNCVQSDIDCLRSIRNTLQDPQGFLSSWSFNNNTEGFICRFIGVECWHPDESKVINIRLSGFGLTGEFPVGVGNCTSLTGLDLSSNKLHGNLPPNISLLLQYVTSLDLSSNNLSGEIPESLSNCTYLNIFKLDSNQFSGQIPGELGRLARLKTFSVANNRLSGRIPIFRNATFGREDYANNSGLCGKPLDPCQGRGLKALDILLSH